MGLTTAEKKVRDKVSIHDVQLAEYCARKVIVFSWMCRDVKVCVCVNCAVAKIE